MGVSRRAFLASLLALPLAACSSVPEPDSLVASHTPPTETPIPGLSILETQYGARLGVFAFDTATDSKFTHNADDRFAFCSTFKALAAAAILHYHESELDRRVSFTAADILSYAPITSQHVDTGMTLRELCDAAVRYSDNTAGNLLLHYLGGRNALTAYARTLGDAVFRMDHTEPDINDAVPGDQRDTTSARAWGEDFRKLLLDDALGSQSRDTLTNWLVENMTGATRIRAALPEQWVVADKTRTGNYGTANDISVIWPAGRPPVVLAVMSTQHEPNANPETQLIRQATEKVFETLGI